MTETHGRDPVLFYRLEGKAPVPCSPAEYVEWRKYSDYRVAATLIGDVLVSTVFLGVDHRSLGYGEPLLFETILARPAFVLGGSKNQRVCARYSTWDEAERGHADICNKVANSS